MGFTKAALTPSRRKETTAQRGGRISKYEFFPVSACKFLPSREHLGHQTGWTHTQPAALGAGFLQHSTETGLFFGEEKITHLKIGRVGSGRPNPFLSLGCFPWRPHRRAEIVTFQCQRQQSSPVPGGNPGEASLRGHGGAARGEGSGCDRS